MSLLWLVFFDILFMLYLKIGIAEGIVGGQEAFDGQFTYQVSVRLNNKHACGGCIISQRHILTAAHCVMSLNTEFLSAKLSILGGVVNTKTSSPYKTEVDVEKVYVPANFKYIVDADVMPIDIALLKLKTDLIFNSSTRLSKIKLPETNKVELFDNEEPVVSGFGVNHVIPHENPAEIRFCIDCTKMRYAKTKIVPMNECSSFYTCPIHNNICARVQQHNRGWQSEGTCKGDSGGPLVLHDTVIGVISTGPVDCDETNHPGVYTRVSSFLSFIEIAMEDEPSPDIRVAAHDVKKQWIGREKEVLVEIPYSCR